MFQAFSAYTLEKELDLGDPVRADPIHLETGKVFLHVPHLSAFQAVKMGMIAPFVLVTSLIPGNIEGADQSLIHENFKRVVDRGLGYGRHKPHQFLVNLVHGGVNFLVCQVLEDLDPVMRGPYIMGSE